MKKKILVYFFGCCGVSLLRGLIYWENQLFLCQARLGIHYSAVFIGFDVVITDECGTRTIGGTTENGFFPPVTTELMSLKYALPKGSFYLSSNAPPLGHNTCKMASCVTLTHSQPKV